MQCDDPARSSLARFHSNAPESGREARLLLQGYSDSFSELNNGELRGSVYTSHSSDDHRRWHHVVAKADRLWDIEVMENFVSSRLPLRDATFEIKLVYSLFLLFVLGGLVTTWMPQFQRIGFGYERIRRLLSRPTNRRADVI